MKENKWWKEVPLIVIMTCPFLVYYYLKPLLPELVPSHYTIDGSGQWVVDGRMAPGGFVTTMFFACLVVYLALSFPLLAKKWQTGLRQQSVLLAPIIYSLKAGLILLFSAIPVYEMLVAGGKLTGGSAAMWSYIGGIALLVLLNLFIYRLYSVMYRHSEEKPLARKSYVIIWASTHVVVSIGPLCALLVAGRISADKMIPQFILVFLAICGNLLYNVRPNPYLGIRTPWTLKNETVWRKTHRMGGIMLFVFGVAGFFATLIANEHQSHYILLSVLLITALVPTAYSYIIYRKLIHQP
ncbi:SdpI family protein [Chitinophaga sp. RAB17]|uniref:SdpI family protein n=1 Tax=Chitinophaga sp. RAB17 TaxID=3233049 RepID=UPI003F934E9E